MRSSFGVRAGLLVFSILASGCHLNRPGEVRPEPIAACDPARVTSLEARFELLSPMEREFLTYCRTAQAATSLRASQEHLDYMADLEFIGILLGVVSAVLTLVVAAAN